MFFSIIVSYVGLKIIPTYDSRTYQLEPISEHARSGWSFFPFVILYTSSIENLFKSRYISEISISFSTGLILCTKMCYL